MKPVEMKLALVPLWSRRTDSLLVLLVLCSPDLIDRLRSSPCLICFGRISFVLGLNDACIRVTIDSI